LSALKQQASLNLSLNTLRSLIEGEAEFFVYYMKNSGEGGKFFRLLHEKQGEGGIDSEN
jgi:hypothetical protein